MLNNIETYSMSHREGSIPFHPQLSFGFILFPDYSVAVMLTLLSLQLYKVIFNKYTMISHAYTIAVIEIPHLMMADRYEIS